MRPHFLLYLPLYFWRIFHCISTVFSTVFSTVLSSVSSSVPTYPSYFGNGTRSSTCTCTTTTTTTSPTTTAATTTTTPLLHRHWLNSFSPRCSSHQLLLNYCHYCSSATCTTCTSANVPLNYNYFNSSTLFSSSSYCSIHLLSRLQSISFPKLWELQLHSKRRERNFETQYEKVFFWNIVWQHCWSCSSRALKRPT